MIVLPAVVGAGAGERREGGLETGGEGGGADTGPRLALPIAFHISSLLMLIGDPSIDSAALAGLTPRLSIKSIMALSETSVRI